MIEFIAENLAPIMFVSLIVFLLLGYPVAFSLAANGLLFFIVGVELAPLSDSINLSWPLLNAMMLSTPAAIWSFVTEPTRLFDAETTAPVVSVPLRQVAAPLSPLQL